MSHLSTSPNTATAPHLINTRQLAISAAGKTAGQTQKKLPLQLIPSKAEARGQQAWTHLAKNIWTWTRAACPSMGISTRACHRTDQQFCNTICWDLHKHNWINIYIYSLITKHVPSTARNDLCTNTGTRLKTKGETICPFQIFCTYETQQRQQKVKAIVQEKREKLLINKTRNTWNKF